eukprot:m51a1_g13111 hypothetical protein (398) ;mRNA; f:697-2706
MLDVAVVGAYGLAGPLTSRVTVTLDGKLLLRTKVAKKTDAPMWDELVSAQLPPEASVASSALLFTLASSKLSATASLKLSDIGKTGTVVERHLELSDAKGQIVGSLRVGVLLRMPDPLPDFSSLRATGAVVAQTLSDSVRRFLDKPSPAWADFVKHSYVPYTRGVSTKYRVKVRQHLPDLRVHLRIPSLASPVADAYMAPMRDSNGYTWTKYYSNGSRGSSGSSGWAGADGHSGANGADGTNGASGTVLFRLLSPQGECVAQSNRPPMLAITNLSLSDENSDGVFEPGEKISVSHIEVINYGDIPVSRRNLLVRLIPWQNVHCGGEALKLPDLMPGERFSFGKGAHLTGRIHTFTAPEVPGRLEVPFEVCPTIECCGRPFKHAGRIVRVTACWPSRL